MNTSRQPLINACCTTALVENLDDATLRSGHALLNQARAEGFSSWIDRQLTRFDDAFRAYATSRSLRQALGR